MIGDKGRREKVDSDDGYKSNSKSPGERKAGQYDPLSGKGRPELYDDLVFHGFSSDFCVCMLDIVNSTAITSSLALEDKIRKFYSLFVNSASPVISRFGGRVLKTGGDSIIYYFPSTTEEKRIEGFKNVLECGISLVDLRGIINSLYKKEGIQPIEYRISADYGRLELAESRFSKDQDFFGPTMNLCAKINNKAPPNSMVIGGDLHQIVKNLHSLEKQFQFQEISEFSIGLKQRYPIHLVVPTNFNSRYRYPELKELVLRQYDIRSQKERPLLTPMSTSRGNIMLVDDQPDMLFTYGSFLEGQGFKVHSFTDPTVALSQFAKEDSSKYDLVVMDIRMPHLNGLQLYQRLRAINSQVRILFVTALDAASELTSLLPEVEANQVIMKPVSRDKFLNYVDLAVRERG
jgi:two-component system, OmpR family, response regulator ChvI